MWLGGHALGPGGHHGASLPHRLLGGRGGHEPHASISTKARATTQYAAGHDGGHESHACLPPATRYKGPDLAPSQPITAAPTPTTPTPVRVTAARLQAHLSLSLISLDSSFLACYEWRWSHANLISKPCHQHQHQHHGGTAASLRAPPPPLGAGPAAAPATACSPPPRPPPSRPAAAGTPPTAPG